MIDGRLTMCLTRVMARTLILLAPAILLLATASHAHSGPEQDQAAPAVKEVAVTDTAEKDPAVSWQR
jgi:hypothetical protein